MFAVYSFVRNTNIFLKIAACLLLTGETSGKTPVEQLTFNKEFLRLTGRILKINSCNGETSCNRENSMLGKINEDGIFEKVSWNY